MHIYIYIYIYIYIGLHTYILIFSNCIVKLPLVYVYFNVTIVLRNYENINERT